MGLLDEYRREKGAESLALNILLRDLREMAETSGTTKDLAVLLIESRIRVTERLDEISDLGEKKTRTTVGLKRGDAEIILCGTRDAAQRVGPHRNELLTAAKAILRVMKKQAEQEVREPEEAPTP